MCIIRCTSRDNCLYVDTYLHFMTNTPSTKLCKNKFRHGCSSRLLEFHIKICQSYKYFFGFVIDFQIVLLRFVYGSGAHFIQSLCNNVFPHSSIGEHIVVW
jgi:hypothetical protein